MSINPASYSQVLDGINNARTCCLLGYRICSLGSLTRGRVPKSQNRPSLPFLGVLVCQDFMTECHQPGGLNSRNALSHSLEAESPKPRYQQGWRLLRAAGRLQIALPRSLLGDGAQSAFRCLPSVPLWRQVQIYLSFFFLKGTEMYLRKRVIHTRGRPWAVSKGPHFPF